MLRHVMRCSATSSKKGKKAAQEEQVKKDNNSPESVPNKSHGDDTSGPLKKQPQQRDVKRPKTRKQTHLGTAAKDVPGTTVQAYMRIPKELNVPDHHNLPKAENEISTPSLCGSSRGGIDEFAVDRLDADVNFSSEEFTISSLSSVSVPASSASCSSMKTALAPETINSHNNPKRVRSTAESNKTNSGLRRPRRNTNRSRSPSPFLPSTTTPKTAYKMNASGGSMETRRKRHTNQNLHIQDDISTTEVENATHVESSPSLDQRTNNNNVSIGKRRKNNGDAKMHCPVCLEEFPRLCYFDEEDYEQRVFSHIIQCSGKPRASDKARASSEFGDGPKKKTSSAPQISAKEGERGTNRNSSRVAPIRKNNRGKTKRSSASPSRRKKSSSPLARNPKLFEQDEDDAGTRDTSSVATDSQVGSMQSDISSWSCERKQPATKRKKASLGLVQSSGNSKKKKPIVIDSGHFLAQTWWRETVRRERKEQIPISKFDISQCVVPREKPPGSSPATGGAALNAASGNNNDKNEGASTSLITRGTRSSRRSADPDFMLCCPICNQEFTPKLIGSMTEDAMGKHVAKCSKRLFDGTDILATFTSSAEKDGTSVVSGNSRTSPSKRKVLVPRKPTPEEAQRQKESYSHRANRMKHVLFAKGGSRKAVSAMLRRDSTDAI